jgi:hypothetical protein
VQQNFFGWRIWRLNKGLKIAEVNTLNKMFLPQKVVAGLKVCGDCVQSG